MTELGREVIGKETKEVQLAACISDNCAPQNNGCLQSHSLTSNMRLHRDEFLLCEEEWRGLNSRLDSRHCHYRMLVS